MTKLLSYWGVFLTGAVVGGLVSRMVEELNKKEDAVAQEDREVH